MSWVIASITAFVALAAAAATARHWLSEPPIGLDTLTFHLPNAARWMQSGSLWQVDEFLPFQSHGSYPNHGELLFTWAMLPFDDDVLVRPLIVAILALLGVHDRGVGARARRASRRRGSRSGRAGHHPRRRRDRARAMPDVLAYFG